MAPCRVRNYSAGCNGIDEYVADKHSKYDSCSLHLQYIYMGMRPNPDGKLSYWPVHVVKAGGVF